MQAATDAQRQLHALVVAAPEGLRGRLRALTTRQLIGACGRLRQRADCDTETAATAASLRTLARRVQVLERETAEHTRAITTLVRAWRPDLLRRCGSARSWPPPCCVPGRMPAAAAPTRRLRCWAAPPHPGLQRPDRPGSAQPLWDRQLNQALHLIVLTRLAYDPATRAYAQRRRAQGKTNREIKRCLVRYVARQLYRQLETPPAIDAT